MVRHQRKTVIAMAVCTICACLIVGCQSRPSFTRGSKIAAYSSPRTAVLVIDLQEDYTGPQAKQVYKESEKMIAEANNLIADAKNNGNLVVFIENVLTNPVLKVITGGLNTPGSPGTEMDRRLIRLPGTRTFTKLDSDAFSNTEFDVFLRENQVNHVIITGLDGAICVDATARGALNRGYKVTMNTQGISKRNGSSLDKLAQGWREAGAEVK